MNKSLEPTKIGDILFTNKGWRKVTKTKPLEFSDDVVASYSRMNEEEVFTTVKIFGWDLFRVFKDKDNGIIKIVLHKDNEFKEFENTTQGSK